MNVRPATRDDIPWLLGQLREFDTFVGGSVFPSIEHAEAFVSLLIAEHVFLVVDGVGFIAGLLGPHPCNPDIEVLSEVFWWVAPKERGSRAGSLLLEAFEKIGRERADWIVMTLEAESPVSPKSLLHRGYQLKETNFLLKSDAVRFTQNEPEYRHRASVPGYVATAEEWSA